MSSGQPYRFHAYERSYFSAKVRPALRAKRLWVQELRADIRQVIALSGLHFVPILETPSGEVWQDTSEILDALEQAHPEPPLMPSTPVQRVAALLVELYADEFGLLPAMHYRWGTETGEADGRAAFRAMIGSDAQAQKAGDQMAAARLAIGATDEAGPAIEAHTRDLLEALSAHFECEPYLLGPQLSLADCGLMGPLYAHLYNDAVSRPMMIGSALPVVAWIERCNYPGDDAAPGWLPADELPPTLRAVLDVMAEDAVAPILAAQREVQRWLDEAQPEAGVKLPRAVGMIESELRATPLRAAARPYTQWMLQRVLDVYAALEASERAAVDRAFAGSGWEALLGLEFTHRFEKRERKLCVA